MLTPDYRPARPSPAHAPSLDGRIVAVVGATGGLGTALCKRLASVGATVVLLGRKRRHLEKLYDVIEPLGAATPALAELDLATTDAADGRAVAEMLYAEFGRLDALVLAAADAGTPTPQAQVGEAEFDRLLRVNVAGPRALTLALQPLMLHSPDASVVAVLDHKPGAYQGAYGLTKLALHALLQQLALESDHLLGEDGMPRVAFNGYDPGPMRTALRRRFYAGEHATEAPAPDERLEPLLHLIARSDRALTGAALAWHARRESPRHPGGMPGAPAA